MKTKKIICFILSLLLASPSLCLSSCDSANVGGLSTEDTQEEGKNDNPNYTAPAKYKELAKDDTVYRSGIYTGYSIVIKKDLKNENGSVIAANLCEIMLDHPGEVDPVHEDPTCSHDSFRCPTSSDAMSEETLIVDNGSGLPIIFFFGIYLDEVYTEDGEARRQKVCEVRGYDVETGEYTTVASIPLGKIEKAVLYKGKIYLIGNKGLELGMVDTVTGETKVVESDEFFNDYNILGIVNDRIYYMHVFGPLGKEDVPDINNCMLKSCSLDLDDFKTEYDFGDFGDHYSRSYGRMAHYSYMDGNMIYFPKNYRYSFDPDEKLSDGSAFFHMSDLGVWDIYALDLDNKSEGEKLILKDVYKCAFKSGKMYYTLVDYKELGEVNSIITNSNGTNEWIFASTDGGTVYEYDLSTGDVREVCRDSGYNIENILEVTDDGKLFFAGYAYCDYEPNMDGFMMYANYNLLDLSTGEVTPLYSQYKDISAEDQ